MKIMSTRPSYKFGTPDCILGPDLGSILLPNLGSGFGHHFGSCDFVFNYRGPKLEDATCEIAALSNTGGLHMILSQDEESSGSFSSFRAKPIQGTHPSHKK